MEVTTTGPALAISTLTFGEGVLYAILGMLVVFFALVLIMVIIKILIKATDKKEAAPAAAAEVPAEAAAEPPAPVKRDDPAPGRVYGKTPRGRKADRGTARRGAETLSRRQGDACGGRGGVLPVRPYRSRRARARSGLQTHR